MSARALLPVLFGVLPLFLATGGMAQAETVAPPAAPPNAVPTSLPQPMSMTLSPPVAPSGATAAQVFQILLGEMALRRGELEIAARAYSDLAFQSRDLAATERAVELTSAARQYGLALALARQWHELAPASPKASQTLIGLLAIGGKINEMAEPISKLMAADDPKRLGNTFLGFSRLFAHHSNRKDVLDLIEQLAKPYPRLAEAQFAVAEAALWAQETTRARQAAERAQRLKPHWAAPVLLEARAILHPAPVVRASDPQSPKLDEAARTDAAVALLTRFLKREPEAGNVRMTLARILLGAKRYPEARRQFDRLLKKNPDDPEAVYALAMLALQEKDYDSARQMLLRLAQMPIADRDTVHYFLGVLETEAGRPDAARLQFAQVKRGQQYLPARARIAQQMAKAKELDAALAFLRASELHSAADKIRLTQMEAELLREAGRYDDAYTLLSAALQANPEEENLLYDTALVAEKAGKPDVMENYLKKLIGLQPGNAHAYNALGYSLADRNVRLEEAHSLIAEAVRLAPEDPFILDSMGWVLYRQGKLEEALSVLQNAYRIRPDPEIAAHLGEVQWMLGRRDEARAIWKKAAALTPDNETLQTTIRTFSP